MQNLCMLRDPNIEKRIVDAVRSRKNEHLFNDEAILEYVLRNKIIRLSPIYNAFECFTRGLHKKSIYCCIQKHIQDIAPLVEWKEAYYHPAVVHFPGSDIFRPFITGLCPHPYQKKYRHYKAASPWSDVRLLSGSVPSWERIFVFLLYKTIPYLAYLARLKAYYYQK